jgi:hypothetical protein
MVADRPGTLSWRVLAGVSGDGWTTPYAFDPNIEMLDGTEVIVDGYMMPYDDEPTQQQFLLTAYQAHCPYCIPGGMPSMIDVIMSKPIMLTNRVVSVRGRLQILRGDEFGLLYQMVDAIPA